MFRLTNNAGVGASSTQIIGNLRAIFSEIFESEEFLILLVEEALSLNPEGRVEYISVLTHSIESINRVLISGNSPSLIVEALAKIQEEIGHVQQNEKSYQTLAALLRIVEEYKIRLKMPNAA